MVSGRCFLGADACTNPQPGGGCAGRTFAPEIEGDGRGAGWGLYPSDGEIRGTIHAKIWGTPHLLGNAIVITGEH